MLTYGQMKEAVNLAMQVETGTINLDTVLDVFENDPDLEFEVINFWNEFNNMTKNALTILAYERARRHLEKCLEVS